MSIAFGASLTTVLAARSGVIGARVRQGSGVGAARASELVCTASKCVELTSAVAAELRCLISGQVTGVGGRSVTPSLWEVFIGHPRCYIRPELGFVDRGARNGRACADPLPVGADWEQAGDLLPNAIVVSSPAPSGMTRKASRPAPPHPVTLAPEQNCGRAVDTQGGTRPPQRDFARRAHHPRRIQRR